MSMTLDHLLRPLDRWLNDPTVEEICIQKPHEAWIFSAGRFKRFEVPGLCAQDIEDIGIVAAAQRRQDWDHISPLLDTDLVGRGRLGAVVYPCVGEECPSLTIRRGSATWPTLAGLAQSGLFKTTRATKTPPPDDELQALYACGNWEQFLRRATQKRKTIVGCGRTASGKTHVSKAIINEVDRNERLITIEDSPELRDIPFPNCVQLYFDNAAKGANAITAADLIVAALRMRPSRLFLQEIRTGEAAVAFLAGLQIGQSGGITTVHATNCAGVFDRLRGLIKQTGSTLSNDDINTQLRDLIDVIVHTSRDDGPFEADEIWYRHAA